MDIGAQLVHPSRFRITQVIIFYLAVGLLL